jgi:hypothetical protein
MAAFGIVAARASHDIARQSPKITATRRSSNVMPTAAVMGATISSTAVIAASVSVQRGVIASITFASVDLPYVEHYHFSILFTSHSGSTDLYVGANHGVGWFNLHFEAAFDPDLLQ